MRAPRAPLVLATAPLFGACHEVVGIEERPPTYAQTVLADRPLVYFRFEEESGDAIDAVSGEPRGAVFWYEAETRTSLRDDPRISRVDTGERQLGRGLLLFAEDDEQLPPIMGDEPDWTARSGGYVVVENVPGVAFDGDAPFTIELWGLLNLDVTRRYFQIPISNLDAYDTGYRLDVYHHESDGTLAFGMRGTPDAFNQAITRSFEPAQLHHYVFTYAGGGDARLYLDGQPGICVSCAAGAMVPSRTSTLVIGAGWSGDGDPANMGFVHGTLDEVAIYDRALSEREVAAHHAAARAR